MRPQLEHILIVWTPFHINQCIPIEKIIQYFLCRINFILHKPISFFYHNYDCLLKKLNLLTIENHRVLLNLRFVYKLGNGYIDCPDLLEHIDLRVADKSLT